MEAQTSWMVCITNQTVLLDRLYHFKKKNQKAQIAQTEKRNAVHCSASTAEA